MRRSVRWTLAALAVTILWVSALLFKASPIEDDIAARANAALRQASLDWAHVALNARDLSLAGNALSDRERSAARRITAEVWGVREVADKTTVSAPVNPYIFKAGLGADGLALYGHVPGEDERDALVAAARQYFAGRPVRAHARIGRGAPEGFQRTARYALGQLARLKAGAVEIRNNKVSIAGEARTAGDYIAVLAALEALPQDFVTGSINIRPPHSDAFFWEAERNGGDIRLGGSIPDVAARRKMLKLARAMFPRTAIRDEMIYASGAPGGLLAAAGYALEAFLQLARARARVESDTLILSGLARDVEAYHTVRRALRSPPAGFASVRAEIAPAVARPFRWQVARELDEIILSGNIPGESERRNVVKFANRQFPRVRLVDTMVVAGGAPDDWLSAAKRAIGEAGRLQFGTAVLSDRKLTVTGRASSPAAARKIEAEIANLKGGYVGTAVLSLDPALREIQPQQGSLKLVSTNAPLAGSDCRTQAAALLASEMIMFGSESAKIQQGSAAVINRLAQLFNRCGGTRIGIAGHTDSSGKSDQNLVLSQLRADAVATALARAGIKRQRMTAAGFGATRPLATNKTVEGRTRNRRIEILVAGEGAPLFTGTVPKIPDLTKKPVRSQARRRPRPVRAFQDFEFEIR